MLVKFDKRLYSEEAIKKAYSEFLNTKPCIPGKSGNDYVVELPDKTKDEELHHFESMVLLYTIEEKRR
ncbi:MAG: hypothetical protein N3B13_04435 [Deltaproteobacteria bacterium]|nr:hypothetical protein [Deltaproteobacteria bacterium]